MPESVVIDLPRIESKPVTVNRTLAAIAVMSCASLLLELALTRLFSVVLFYHFAFLAISVALLGLGAGGVFAHVRREWLQQWNISQLGSFLALANALLIVLVLEVVLHSSISLKLTLNNFGKLTILYLTAALPFFITGLLFSVVFAREHEGVSRLYGFDLLGGALACVCLVPLLNLVGGPNTTLVSAALMAVAALFWANRQPLIRRGSLAAIVLLVALMILNHSGKLFDIIYAKGARQDSASVLFAKWNAISRIEVDQIGKAKWIVIDADASSAIMNVDPRHWDITPGANVTGTKMEGDPADRNVEGFSWKRDLMKAVPSIANILRPQGSYAIIGPGGGVDVMRAVANGSPSVTGIEINPLIVNDVMRGRYADYAYHLYERPDVDVHVSDGRSYIRSTLDRFDVVQMTLVDTWATTAAGAFALSENNLYTVEAFKEYFEHLNPDGFIAITRWEFKEPREALRVVSQSIEALHELGVSNPRRHFIVISDGELNQDGRPVLVLAKKSPFTAEEVASVRTHLEQNKNLVPIYVPDNLEMAESPAFAAPSADAHAFRHLISSNQPASFAAAYKFDVSPVFDSAPFFFFTLKTKDIVRQIAGTRGGLDWKVNVGIVVLGIVLLISIVAVVAFLVLPLLLHARSSAPHVPPLLYFVCVGLGYILVEITLIQRFVLFLGHPTYALTVVVFLMLLSSGAGSLFVRGKETLIMMRSAIIWIILLALLDIFLLPRILAALVGLPFLAKLAISAVVIAPLAFLMGMPFPTGLRSLASGGQQNQEMSLTEWAWAMNAAASVLGSVAAMVIAIHLGLSLTLLSGALAYLIAICLSGTLTRQGWGTR
jgi:hypothetical protein